MATGQFTNFPIDWESISASSVPFDPGDTGLIATDVQSAIEELKSGGTGLSDAAKLALLNCFAHVAWIDNQGQTYYDALEAALYPPANLVSISAVYTQSGTVYTTDTLDSLKADLVVTATYDDSSTAVVTTYTLSGTLTVGTSTITVSYGGKTTTFTVTVKAGFRYTPADGKLSDQSYITKTDTQYGSVSEAIVGDTLEIITPKSSSGSYPGSAYEFSPSTFTTRAHLTAEFKMTTLNYLQTGNATSLGVVQFLLGNGSSSGGYGLVRYGSNSGDLKGRYHVGSTISWGSSVTLDTWHTIDVLIENDTQTITIDDTVVVNAQALGTTGDSSLICRLNFASLGQSTTDCYFKSIEFSAE